MERLFVFIYQYRAFFTFLILEVTCIWLIVRNNQYQSAKFFNSSNTVVASLNNFSQSIRDYFLLRDVNKSLAEENARLRKMLEEERQRLSMGDTVLLSDSLLITRYDFLSAKVVNNQVDKFKNFITIDKGSRAGVEAGMAVISPEGIVGKVKVVSNQYAVVMSLLNIDMMVSSVLRRTGHFGSVQWNGLDPSTVQFKFIPRHVKPIVGDTVQTSGYNAVFPDGMMIGTISKVDLSPEALFYELDVQLSQDFRKLSFVTVVKSKLKNEQDSLEQTINVLAR